MFSWNGAVGKTTFRFAERNYCLSHYQAEWGGRKASYHDVSVSKSNYKYDHNTALSLSLSLSLKDHD